MKHALIFFFSFTICYGQSGQTVSEDYRLPLTSDHTLNSGGGLDNSGGAADTLALRLRSFLSSDAGELE